MRYSTLFVGLHGELILRQPWQDLSLAKSDAYSLFVAKSVAMSWLENPSNGLWGMNDAGIHTSASQQSEIASRQAYAAWFQVGLLDPFPSERPLPVQPFLACAGAVVEKMGHLHIEAIQILLPIQLLKQSGNFSAIGGLLQGAGWFADQLPQDRVRVQLTLNGGQNCSIYSVAPELFKWMQTIQQNVILWESFALTKIGNPIVLKPLFIDELWNGPTEQQITFRGALVEWSLDALGWVAAFLASASSRYGVSVPLVLTIQPE